MSLLGALVLVGGVGGWAVLTAEGVPLLSTAQEWVWAIAPLPIYNTMVRVVTTFLYTDLVMFIYCYCKNVDVNKQKMLSSLLMVCTNRYKKEHPISFYNNMDVEKHICLKLELFI